MMDVITGEMDFNYFALAHHDNSEESAARRVRLFKYPDAVVDRLVEQGTYRRDPIVRGCVATDTAFLWSDLPDFLGLNRSDHDALAFGAREGLNEGITVPILRLGDAVGSCTFAGAKRPERAERFLGAAQMI